MSNVYSPDCWVLMKIPFEEGPEVKVLGGWSGGYLDGDSWRLSSGVKSVTEDDDYWVILNNSGSTYRCHKEAEGVKMSIGHVHSQLIEKHDAKQISMEECKLSDCSLVD